MLPCLPVKEKKIRKEKGKKKRKMRFYMRGLFLSECTYFIC